MELHLTATYCQLPYLTSAELLQIVPDMEYLKAILYWVKNDSISDAN